MEILILQAKHRMFSPSLYPNKVMLQKVRLYHSPQSLVSAQLLSASINVFCFKQSKEIYESDTAVLHGIISKSDEVNAQF